MKIENLRIFLMVAQVLNINKAADELFLSHQNLSFIIKNMEKELGMTLFTRSKTGLQLTNDGYDFLQVVQPIVSSYDAFLNAKSAKNTTAVIDVYTTPTLASYLSEVKEINSFENCFLSLHKRNPNEITELLERKQQGVYLVPVLNGYPQIVANDKEKIVLLHDSQVFIAHRNHPLASRERVTQQALSEVLMITSSYYVQNVKNSIVVNIDNLVQCKKMMREHDFCYGATKWVYQTFFEAEGDWCMLDVQDVQDADIMYVLIINLPIHRKKIVLQTVVPVLKTIF